MYTKGIFNCSCFLKMIKMEKGEIVVPSRIKYRPTHILKIWCYAIYKNDQRGLKGMLFIRKSNINVSFAK